MTTPIKSTTQKSPQKKRPSDRRAQVYIAIITTLPAIILAIVKLLEAGHTFGWW